ncbi:hypothetical protein K0M31_011235, partial [Melipona bicolor]
RQRRRRQRRLRAAECRHSGKSPRIAIAPTEPGRSPIGDLEIQRARPGDYGVRSRSEDHRCRSVLLCTDDFVSQKDKGRFSLAGKPTAGLSPRGESSARIG